MAKIKKIKDSLYDEYLGNIGKLNLKEDRLKKDIEDVKKYSGYGPQYKMVVIELGKIIKNNKDKLNELENTIISIEQKHPDFIGIHDCGIEVLENNYAHTKRGGNK